MPVRDKPVRYAAAAQEDRCADRSAVTIPSSLRPSGGRAFATTVLDLSLAGFSAACPDRMLPGTVCWLTLPAPPSLDDADFRIAGLHCLVRGGPEGQPDDLATYLARTVARWCTAR